MKQLKNISGDKLEKCVECEAHEIMKLKISKELINIK